MFASSLDVHGIRQARCLAGLKALGAEVIEIPFIEIRPPRSYKRLDSALKRIDEYDWLILTSVNGVEALASRIKKLKIKPEKLTSVRVAAIGPSTREAAEKLGLKVAIVPKQYVAESVVESLRGQSGREASSACASQSCSRCHSTRVAEDGSEG